MLTAVVLVIGNVALAWYFGEHNAAVLFTVFVICSVISLVTLVLAMTHRRLP